MKLFMLMVLFILGVNDAYSSVTILASGGDGLREGRVWNAHLDYGLQGTRSTSARVRVSAYRRDASDSIIHRFFHPSTRFFDGNVRPGNRSI